MPETRWGWLATNFTFVLSRTKNGFHPCTTSGERLSKKVHSNKGMGTDTTVDVADSFFKFY